MPAAAIQMTARLAAARPIDGLPRQLLCRLAKQGDAIGVAMCWELIRTATLRRLRGKVGLAVGGSCWWDVPYGSDSPELERVRDENVALCEKAPPAFAHRLGVPLVHAAWDAQNAFGRKNYRDLTRPHRWSRRDRRSGSSAPPGSAGAE